MKTGETLVKGSEETRNVRALLKRGNNEWIDLDTRFCCIRDSASRPFIIVDTSN